MTSNYEPQSIRANVVQQDIYAKPRDTLFMPALERWVKKK